MKQNNWEQQLRERMAGYEQPVPDDLWHDIEQATRPDSAPRRVGLGRWWLAAAAVAVLIVGGALTIGLRRSGPDRPSVSVQSVAVVPGNAAPADPSADAVAPTEEPESPTVAAHQRLLAVATVQPSGRSQQEPAAEPQPLTAETPATEPAPVPTTSGETTAGEVPTQPTDRAASPTLEPRYAQTVPPYPRQHNRRRLTLSASLMASNAMTTPSLGNSVLSQPMILARSYVASFSSASSDWSADTKFLMSDYANDTKHRLPVTLGATLRLGLDRHCWVESGLHYTTTHTTFTHLLAGYVSTDEQRLKYVGVPLNVGYTLWQGRLLSAYASAGATADVCVDVDMESDGRQLPMERDRVQFSLGGSVGVSYQLMPWLSLYAQPGLRYYPDNGSRLQNIFKEKPLNIDLQFGIRFGTK